MDGLNCDPMSFDKECELTNAHFHKIRNMKISKVITTLSATIQPMLKKTDLPERAQAISLELAKQMFPGYQALVVTHTDLSLETDAL